MTQSLSFILAAGEKLAHPWVGGIRQQIFGIAGRDLHTRVSIEKNAVIANREDAGEFVSDRHDRCPQTIA